MDKTFKLVDKYSGEIVMYGESAKVCRIYAVKHSLALAHQAHNEKLTHTLNKPNQVKAFYKAKLDELYTVEEVAPIKVWTLNEVQAISWFSLWGKLFFKKS